MFKESILANNVFSILQWNTLANCYTDQKSFPKVDPKYLDFTYRHELQKRYIKLLNPDIACFEEVDQINSFNLIFPNNYQTYWQPKSNQDGTFVAINKDKFEVLSADPIKYQDKKGEKQSQYFWYINLKHKVTGQKILLVPTHLKAREEFEEIRVQQVQFLHEYISSDKKIDQENTAVIICGDFNSEPNQNALTLFNKCFPSYENIFKDAEYTTYKIRSTVLQRVIDYLFYSPKFLTPISRVDLPTKTQANNTGFPTYDFPSDHLFLYATFQVSKK